MIKKKIKQKQISIQNFIRIYKKNIKLTLRTATVPLQQYNTPPKTSVGI